MVNKCNLPQELKYIQYIQMRTNNEYLENLPVLCAVLGQRPVENIPAAPSPDVDLKNNTEKDDCTSEGVAQSSAKSQNFKKRCVLCAGIVVIISAIILGIVFSREIFLTRGASPSSNLYCEGAQPIFSRVADIVASVEGAAEQGVVFCEDEAQTKSFQPGVWYKVSGVRGV